MITVSPGMAGFVKGLLGVVVLVVVSYLANAANLTGILNPTLSIIIAGLFSGIESSLKAKANGSTALFGAVKLS